MNLLELVDAIKKDPRKLMLIFCKCLKNVDNFSNCLLTNKKHIDEDMIVIFNKLKTSASETDSVLQGAYPSNTEIKIMFRYFNEIQAFKIEDWFTLGLSKVDCDLILKALPEIIQEQDKFDCWEESKRIDKNRRDELNRLHRK